VPEKNIIIEMKNDNSKNMLEKSDDILVKVNYDKSFIKKITTSGNSEEKKSREELLKFLEDVRNKVYLHKCI